jgi:glycosyltransferase involved in cell wall biosynthesis
MTSATTPEASPVAQDVRVLAFYRLPDAAQPVRGTSGEELPEWTRVRAARPGFAGHEQPQIPGELGYCNVRDARVREAQAALARSHAVSGFCYVLRSPGATTEINPTFADIVATGRPDFPFCVCWETTSLHAGAGFGAGDEHRERRFKLEECVALIRELVRVFVDRRYLRIGERPLFIVSSPDPIVEVRAVAARWREECARAGAGNPYIACFGGAQGGDPAQLGFDATIECPPLGGFAQSKRDDVVPIRPDFAGDVRNYRSYVGHLLVSDRPEHTMFRSVMPGWDETVRTTQAAQVFVSANAETFGYWAERAIDQTRLRFAGDERLLFVRSWNEWDAACHLEPEMRHGRRYLEALRAAVLRPPAAAPARPSWGAMRAWTAARGGLAAARVVRAQPRESARGPLSRVSVVMPAYNHERYVVAALDSVVAQTHANVEIIVVDDGSTDATGAMLDDYAARCRTHALTIVHQANAGAHEAINHGLALARGETIAVMNSDDLYAPTRLERLLREMDHREAGFAFSNTRFIDDAGLDIEASDPYVKKLQRAIVDGIKAPDFLYVLVYNNIAISTGNFVFRRDLLERIGGFCAMRVCHDWDFLLAASHETPLAFIDEPLYLYRLHGTNTFSSSRVQAAFELEQLLARFFATLGDHPLAGDPAELERFLSHVRELGLGGYLPRHAATAG